MQTLKSEEFWPAGDAIAAHKSSWQLLARSFSLGLGFFGLAFAYLSFGSRASEGAQISYWILGALMLVNAAAIAWHCRWKSISSLQSGLSFCDALLITTTIYLSGGPQSPILFIYLPLVMAASVQFSQRDGLIMAGVCGLAYSVLAWCLVHGIIPSADESLITSAPTGGLILQIVGLCSAMVLIAVAGSFLSRAIESRDRLVEQSRMRLIDLSDRQKSLINSLPESMVMTLSDQSIVSVNDAACKLLQISETSCSARKLHEVLRQIDGRLQIEKLIGKDGAEVRGELELPSANGPLRIKFYGRPVSALLPGSQSGLVFVFQDITKLRSIEEQLELHERMARLLAQSSTQSQQTYDSGSGQIEVDDKGVMFVGESVVMKKVFGLIQKVAPSDATILIYGESGTGKELVARAIHHGSGRTGGPFVAVNCGAIPETLIESELFGHKKGSFTSAHSDNSGLFRQAHGGTIFLDEIGELPVHVQSKLLRSIQERSVRPVGGDRDVPVDVRIIAATNRNLRKEIEEHNFREDLYYRLNVISVNLPPLRERKEDLPVLVHTILKKLVSADVVPTVPPQTMQILINYNYPGNVRELENILERAFVLGGEVILPEQLPDFVREYDGSQVTPLSLRGETKLVIDEKLELPVNLDQILNNIERRYLEVALVNTSGAKKKAAELLGMNFRSFRYRLQKYGLSAED